ncbi:MFS transporter [Pseudanabaena sp. PCC 6802]|uniref:MFS transporter n=1 Tax=Pseudanabaena sp. PCC 6802 TaxID=118173 RepID=UPI00034D3701|nr:MFS transporter [Pseudanabaena sp. PCC 6802]
MKSQETPSEQLSFSTKLTYGAGYLAIAAPSTIQALFFLYFLTNIAGLNASLAGMVLLIGRVWDAINDPLVGWLSDRTQSRWGTRSHWILWGVIPFGIFFAMLWVVPNFGLGFDSRQNSLFWYYAIVSILFDTAFTAITVPYQALAPGLTQSYTERTSLSSIQSMFTIGGSIVSLVLARTIFSIVANSTLQYQLVGGVFAGFAVLVMYFSALRIRRQVKTEQSSEQPVPSIGHTFRSQLHLILQNRSFLCVVGIYFFSNLAINVMLTTTPYFIVNWMRLSDRIVTQVVLAAQVAIVLTLVVWNAARYRVDKRVIYSIGIPIAILAQIGMFFLQPGQVVWLYALSVLRGIGASVVLLVPFSMLPDVVDLDELLHGQRREGIFYGFMTQFQKFGAAIALFGVGKSLDWAGFVSNVAGQQVLAQPDAALWVIRLIFGPATALLLGLSLVLAYFYPITRQDHAIICLKLSQRN